MSPAAANDDPPVSRWARFWKGSAKKKNEGPSWETLADKLSAVGASILNVNVAQELASNEPKFMGLALLARTLSNFRAARLLLKQGQLLEARVISRCCHENLFWIAALSKRGVEFVDEMFGDGSSHIHKQAQRLLPEENFNFDMTNGRPEAIRHLQAAQQGDVADAYVSYASLSAEAAHPSVFSLTAHMERTADGRSFICRIQNEMSAQAAANTLQELCSVVLKICMAADRLIGETSATETLPKLAKEHDFLRYRWRPLSES